MFSNLRKAMGKLLGRQESHGAPSSSISMWLNTPVMMQQRALDALIASAGAMPAREAMRDDEDSSYEGSKPEHLIEMVGDIGVLRITGPLFHRWSIMAWWYGGTGYDMIVAAHRMLVANAAVREIVHLHDSNGGMVSGCFDATDAIKATRGTKPITAVISDASYSASYCLASAADRRVISRTGGAGSIGVRATVVDISGWDAQMGVKYTTVIEGEKKADFDIHAPASARALAELQVEVTRLGVMFRETVAANTGLDVAAIQNMQAGCFHGPDAVTAGLADEVGTYESVMSGLILTTESQEVDAVEASAKPAGGPPAEDEEAHAATAPPAPEAVADVAAVADVVAAPVDHIAALATAITAAKLPEPIAAALVKRGPIAEQTADQAVAHAQLVRSTCAAVNLELLAPEFIGANTPIDQVRSKISALRMAGDEEVNTTHPPKNAARAQRTDIYARRRAQLQGQPS